ncbi:MULTISPECIES: UDP-glucose 4-epimerase GalE [unclassified Bradyrhizobium]|uniref:UDP-glucose 4-epimerase GalE n=1 Tax=unclassified Bradyrhizobium TaxID=2631580 RepID=UPI001FF9D872|nr:MULTISPECIES: UDP-glucose 4-epimerase GalE [unclassified Bradyrhizobium]MCK1540309.1 UDP-glucose 4-epimerase GalE [Bradyrhizobium sp. 176]MCK1556151.1 UDP-glucose 4-epimerase GalE [Bradyrhizobium sp. 171]
MKLPILVTGGAGYIGAHCCNALADAGFAPITFDNLSTGHTEFVKWGPLVVGDVRDCASVNRAISDHKAAAVVHLAAASLVGESVVDPEKYYSHNVEGSLSVLRAMRETGCNHMVFSSTGAVYGNAGSEALSEQLPCSPVNPYGRSKLMVEHALADYKAAYGLTSFALRYFNASGARPEADIGEQRQNETHLIPRAMSALSGQLGEFAIFGTDYATPDGTAIRDYIHVMDLAAAHVSAVQALLAGQSGACCNLGTGRGYSVKQVLDAIADFAGRNVPRAVRERRAGDPPVLVADPSAARRIIHFRAAASDLRTIVSSAWAWHVSRHGEGTPARAPVMNSAASGKIANATVQPGV